MYVLYSVTEKSYVGGTLRSYFSLFQTFFYSLGKLQKSSIKIVKCAVNDISIKSFLVS